MQIKKNLLIKDSRIIEGLQDGSLKRRGGILYQVETGITVHLLVETPTLTKQLQDAPQSPVIRYGSAIKKGIGYIKKLNDIYRQNQQIPTVPQQQLPSVLQLTQIAAGASVLNLGVSIAGFAYMGYKLHQIQNALDNVQKSLETGFNRIEERLDYISGQLAYLHLLVENSRNEQQRISKAISEVYRALLIKELSELEAVILYQSRYPNTPVQDAIKIASRIRIFLADQAMRENPVLDAQKMLITDVAIQGWAVATTIEAYLLLQDGQINEAQSLLAREVANFRKAATEWADSLLTHRLSQISTAYRFAAPLFEDHILLERVERIAYISSVDKFLSNAQIKRKKITAEVEFNMSYAQKEFDEKWVYKQIAVAEYLDTLSELLARLESLQTFANLCKSKGVKNSFELLPSDDAEPGLYCIEVI